VADSLDPAVQRVVDAAAVRGVGIEVTLLVETSHTAEDAARALGVELGQIVKSLVFVAPGADDELRPILCLVAGTNRVDMARLAAVTGEPAVRRASAREARQLTGYSIGGIPPIGHPGPVRAVMDPDLEQYAVVWAAAGLDGAVFPVPPTTLRALAEAVTAPIGAPAGRGPGSAPPGGASAG
jgi:prolyl-tRNA editing enzyme YbaK/EbsC (Cys-tRNA(Pro) deacylase)